MYDTEEGKAGGALCMAQKKVEARGTLWECSLAQKKIKNSDFFKAPFFPPLFHYCSLY